MVNSQRRTAVVLFNLGGPKNLESVQPFLFNLFNDKAIISLIQPFRYLLAKLISSRRAEKSKKIYSQIGGKSPLLDITLTQAHALEQELSFLGNFKVFVAMRYAEPFSTEVAQQVMEYDPTHAILLPLYPQFSTTTSESSLIDFSDKFTKAQQQFNKKVETKMVCCYPVSSRFIAAHANLIKQTLMKSYDGNLEKFRFLFSAHGLPQKVIDAGDPYAFQVEETTKKVVENLSHLLNVSEDKIDFRVCYQSKVGPLQWTGPSLEHEIRRAALDQKNPVVVPISFVSEHSETLVELDIDFKNMAYELGIKNYLRVPALNTNLQFIQSLSEICQIVANEFEADLPTEFGTVNKLEKAKRICPKKFSKCPNKDFCQTND